LFTQDDDLFTQDDDLFTQDDDLFTQDDGLFTQNDGLFIHGDVYPVIPCLTRNLVYRLIESSFIIKIIRQIISYLR